MVKKAIALGIVAAAVGLVGVLPIARSQGSNTETIKAHTIDAKDRTVSVDSNDNGEEDGGDLDIGSGPMFDGDKRIGGIRHMCALLPGRDNAFRLECEGTFSFRGRGSIIGSGSLTFRRRDFKDTLAITGGTGEFKNVSGSIVFTGTRKGLKLEFRVIEN